jgi:hypothetical protein
MTDTTAQTDAVEAAAAPSAAAAEGMTVTIMPPGWKIEVAEDDDGRFYIINSPGHEDAVDVIKGLFGESISDVTFTQESIEYPASMRSESVTFKGKIDAKGEFSFLPDKPR